MIELLVASTLGLMLVIGVMKAFQEITRSVTRGRAVVKLSEDIRRTTNVLRSDLEGLTVKCIPNLASNEDSGYFELIEGPKNDKNSIPLPNGLINDITGDTDDILMFTSRRTGDFFSGRIQGYLLGSSEGYENLESPDAEIIYWLELRNTDNGFDGRDNDGNDVVDEEQERLPLTHNGMPIGTLRRRALLIRPNLNGPEGVLLRPNSSEPIKIALDSGGNPILNDLFLMNFINSNDLSIRLNADGTISANSLADLTMRQNRVAHIPTGIINNEDPDKPNYKRDLNFPYPFTNARLPFQFGYFSSDDVLLEGVVGFDLRVFDPHVPIQGVVELNPDTNAPELIDALSPTDPGYNFSDNTRPVISYGAFSDLGWRRETGQIDYRQTDYLSGLPHPKSGLLLNRLPDENEEDYKFRLQNSLFIYDTWTQRYERDGINQDRDYYTDQDGDPLTDQEGNPLPLIDEGTNGLDDDGENGIDDPGESETQPPYNVPLRGIQVIIRAFETGQQQLRQATVSHNFTSE